MARALNLTAADLKRLGVIDEILPEPEEGAHTNGAGTAATIKEALLRTLGEVLADSEARYRNGGTMFRDGGDTDALK